MYKNAVIRFFSKPPVLIRAKETFIKDLVTKDSDVLIVAYYPTEKKAIDMIKIASKPWEGYSII